jgi:hypothetical protein
MHDHLESIADEILCAAGLEPPIDVYRLALRCRFEVRVGHRPMRPTVLGRTVIVSPSDPTERQRFATAHELSHVFLRERGVHDSEWNVNWLASALLHPRTWFLEKLDARGWDLAGLRVDCPWSSYEALGRRVVNVSRAVLWVCDRGPHGASSRRTRSAGVTAKLDRPTRAEWSIVRDAAANLEPRQSEGLGAWPLPRPDRGLLRVVSLGRADELVRLAA